MKSCCLLCLFIAFESESTCSLEMFSILFSHSLVPVVPSDLLEMVQLPSLYIMGLHTSLRRRVEEMVRPHV